MAKEYFEEQYYLSQQAIKEADQIIFYLREKDTANQFIIQNQKEIYNQFTQEQKKQTRKEKFTIAAIGFLAGAFLVALIL